MLGFGIIFSANLLLIVLISTWVGLFVQWAGLSISFAFDGYISLNPYAALFKDLIDPRMVNSFEEVSGGFRFFSAPYWATAAVSGFLSRRHHTAWLALAVLTSLVCAFLLQLTIQVVGAAVWSIALSSEELIAHVVGELVPLGLQAGLLAGGAVGIKVVSLKSTQ